MSLRSTITISTCPFRSHFLDRRPAVISFRHCSLKVKCEPKRRIPHLSASACLNSILLTSPVFHFSCRHLANHFQTSTLSGRLTYNERSASCQLHLSYSVEAYSKEARACTLFSSYKGLVSGLVSPISPTTVWSYGARASDLTS